MRRLSHFLILPMALASATTAGAQTFTGYPGTHLRVDVQVASLTHGGDSTRIAYRVSNSPLSEEQLSRLTLDAPSPARSVRAPNPRSAWRTWTRMGTADVVRWTIRDDVTLVPGTSVDSLSYTAAGIPGIITARYEGYAPPVDIETLDDDDPRLTNRVTEVTTVPLKVVGVVPMPDAPTPASLAARLASLVRESCAQGWITDNGVCTSLAQLADGPAPALDGFVARLDAARNKAGAVSDNAYWLLRANAEIARDLGR